jgi:hypothetical protein
MKRAMLSYWRWRKTCGGYSLYDVHRIEDMLQVVGQGVGARPGVWWKYILINIV